MTTNSCIDIIAEIGQAHDGSLGMAHSFIDALSKTGVNAVKFQVHIAEAESSEHEKFRVNFSYEDDSRRDYWKRMEFTPEQWAGLKKHCEDEGLEFLASPFSNAAVDLLEGLNVSRYKIGSGEVSNHLLLNHIATTRKPIILSSGLSSFDELDKAITLLRSLRSSYSILQCTTAYPTKPEDWGLNVISLLKDRYDCLVGFSDHSGNIYACLAASALGASILEFHTTFDRRMFGPDSKSSLTIDEIEKLVVGVRSVQSSLKNPIDKNSIEKLHPLKQMFEKSLAVNKDLTAGSILTLSDLEAKKPAGYGIPASDFKSVIGKKINRDVVKWSFLNFDLLLND